LGCALHFLVRAEAPDSPLPATGRMHDRSRGRVIGRAGRQHDAAPERMERDRDNRGCPTAFRCSWLASRAASRDGASTVRFALAPLEAGQGRSLERVIAPPCWGLQLTPRILVSRTIAGPNITQTAHGVPPFVSVCWSEPVRHVSAPRKVCGHSHKGPASTY
jgi:hypothetical protein